jgi:hypothetical protein
MGRQFGFDWRMSQGVTNDIKEKVELILEKRRKELEEKREIYEFKKKLAMSLLRKNHGILKVSYIVDWSIRDILNLRNAMNIQEANNHESILQRHDEARDLELQIEPSPKSQLELKDGLIKEEFQHETSNESTLIRQSPSKLTQMTNSINEKIISMDLTMSMGPEFQHIPALG